MVIIHKWLFFTEISHFCHFSNVPKQSKTTEVFSRKSHTELDNSAQVSWEIWSSVFSGVITGVSVYKTAWNVIHIQTAQCLHRESRQLNNLRTQITTLCFTSTLTNVDSSYPQKILWAENFSVRWYFNNFYWFRTTLPYLWDEILTDTFTSTNRIFWSILVALQLPVVIFKRQGNLRGIQIHAFFV